MNTVRYANGMMMLTETDIATPGSNWLFGHQRTYGNQPATLYDGPNGYNWTVSQLAYAKQGAAVRSSSFSMPMRRSSSFGRPLHPLHLPQAAARSSLTSRGYHS